MFTRFLVAGLAVAATLAGGPALAWRSSNGFIVNRTGELQFEVQSRGGLGPSNAWCAAGDFVIRNLGLPTNTRIWRASPPPQKAGKPILFTLSPEDRHYATGLAQIGGSGAAMTAGLAQQICWTLGEPFE